MILNFLLLAGIIVAGTAVYILMKGGNPGSGDIKLKDPLDKSEVRKEILNSSIYPQVHEEKNDLTRICVILAGITVIISALLTGMAVFRIYGGSSFSAVALIVGIPLTIFAIWVGIEIIQMNDSGRMLGIVFAILNAVVSYFTSGLNIVLVMNLFTIGVLVHPYVSSRFKHE